MEKFLYSCATETQTLTATKVETASRHILVWMNLHRMREKNLTIQEMDQFTRITLEW